MSETALLMQQRTPEQDVAFLEAMREVQNIMRTEVCLLSPEEVERIYRATLRRHMVEALQPFIAARARLLALLPSPGVIVHAGGRMEDLMPPSRAEFTALDELMAAIEARYTKGLNT